jgi:putative flippase GtrA
MSAPLPLPTPLTIARPAPGAIPPSGRTDLRRLGLGVTPPLSPALVRQLARFAVIGVISTAVQLGLFLLLRDEVGALTANLVSLVLSTLANTAANRRITFGIRGRAGAGRHQLLALVVFGLSLALSTGALGLLELVAPAAGWSADLIVLLSTNALGAVARFALLRGWVFGPRLPA